MTALRVAVVGGGVIGLATALELLDRGCRVDVYEASRVGRGATRAAAGMLAPVSEADIEDPRLVAFGRESLAGYRQWTDALTARSGISCEYRADGALWVAVRRDDMAEIDHLVGTLTQQELPCERLDARGVVEHEPRLAGRLVGGLRIPSDHQVNPRALTRALVSALRKGGASVWEDSSVESLIVERTGWRVGPGNASSIVDRVVVATGAVPGSALHPALEPLSVRPVKGQAVILRGASGAPDEALIRHVIRTPEVYLVPRDDGSLYVGATVEEMGFDTGPTAGAAMDLLRRAWETLPGVYELGWDEIAVGLRPATADHLPVIGPVDGAPGLFVSVGHYRNGILLAPASARHLASAIVDGSTPPPLEPFRPSRMSRAGSAARKGEAR